jgi:hypothetical protein
VETILIKKVSKDLKSTQIPINDDSIINISHINLDDKKEIGTPTNELNIYGIVDNQFAFKNSYELSSNQIIYLTENKDNLTVLTRFREIIEKLHLTKHDFSDLKAMSLGLTTEQQMKDFTKLMGPVVSTNEIFKHNYNKNPDAFFSIYSKLTIQEKNNKHYVVMDVEGFDVHEDSTPNFYIGFLSGQGMYNATKNPAMSYSFGISMAFLTAIEKCDTYLRTDRIVAEIGEEQTNMKTEELREWLIQGMLNGTISYSKNNLSCSENLHCDSANQTYNKIAELEQ